jgi:hypothetical protein
MLLRKFLHLADGAWKTGEVGDVEGRRPRAYLPLDIHEIDFKPFTDSIELHLSAGVDQRFNLHTMVI